MKHRILSFLLVCTFLFLPTPPVQAVETADGLISAFPVGKENESAEPLRAPEDSLQHSTLVQPWTINDVQYNCYTYALGITYTSKRPGEYSNHSYNSGLSLSVLAQYVVDDLASDQFNMPCASVTDIMPTSLPAGTKLICLRKSPSGDFHFMKKDGSSWYHKPGESAVLKYNYTPSVSRVWINEGIIRGGYFAGDRQYTGDIAYIAYKATHGPAQRTTWTGEHYHSDNNTHSYKYWMDCSDCEEHLSTTWVTLPCTGPTCLLPYAVPIEPIDNELLHIN